MENEEQELTEEERRKTMSWWEDDRLGESKYISIKVGEEEELEIKEIGINEDVDPKFQPKDANGQAQGFAIRIVTIEDKILNVGAYALQGALRGAKVEEGDIVMIKHPSWGKWEVVKKNEERKAEPAKEKGIEPGETPLPFSVALEFSEVISNIADLQHSLKWDDQAVEDISQVKHRKSVKMLKKEELNSLKVSLQMERDKQKSK